VKLAQTADVVGLLAAVVEAIVGLGHALVAGDHEGGAVVVIGFAGRPEFRRGVQTEWQRKIFKRPFNSEVQHADF
jgi:hypothetical protein